MKKSADIKDQTKLKKIPKIELHLHVNVHRESARNGLK